MRITVLYADQTIVAVDKPAGMPAHAEPDDPCGGDALRATAAQTGRPHLRTAYWLDREASGVLLLTAQPEVEAALAAAWASSPPEKVYLALVHGRPAAAEGIITAQITHDRGERYRVASPRAHGSQRAVTRYRLLETSPDGRYSLLEVTPEAERTHQVRVHLAHLGVPLVGDPLYGAPGAGGRPPGAGARARRAVPTGKTGRPQATTPVDPSATAPAPRLGLHLLRLSLAHPATGQPLTFTAPPPPLFTRLATGLPELALFGAGRHVRKLRPQAPGLDALIATALARRAPLAGDPQTDIYRLINAAGDGFPGLAADRYGPALVLSLYDEAARADPPPPALVQKLAEAGGARTVYVKYRQRQASRVEEEERPALAPPLPLLGAPLGEYTAHEEGLAYVVRPGEGWNPGLFPDMREMRGRVRAWAAGQRVLNCFAYTCGFGLAALAGGASHVVNLDVSWPALERGRANYRANGFVPTPDGFLYGDTLDWLPRLAAQGERFDLVILDPPGFARTKTHTFSAAHDYDRLVALAAAVTAPGGLLIACCNVADLPWSRYRERVAAGLDQGPRPARIAGAYGAPALDFPTLPGPEGHLKILVCRFE